MALALNTAHPLYSSLLALICVDDDNTVKDLKGNQTCTKDAACSIISSAGYGRAFRTTLPSGNARGVAMSPGIVLGQTAKSVFIVTNAINSLEGSRFMAINIMGISGWSPAVTSSYYPRMFSNDNGAALEGTASVKVGGHSWGGCADRTNNLAKTFADGAIIANGVKNNAGYGSSTPQTYIGGEYSGSYGGVAADYVWVAFFDKYLSDAEISDLHSSLGANNAFSLIASGNAAPTFTGPNIGNQTGTVGTALTGNNIASKFSDTDALTFSAIGTWPPGVTVSSAGVISGTPTTAGTYSGLAVRATDTVAQTVDSDTFTFTISAAGDTTAPTLTGSITISSLTTTSYTASWSAGSDNVAVTGYQYRIASGSWVDAGNVLTVNITGRTPGATESFEVRAYDAAANYSTPALSTSVTLNSAATGTIMLPALKDWGTGNLKANVTGVTIIINNASTGVLVNLLTDQTANASGVLPTLTGLVSGTAYRVTTILADGSEGTWKYTAS